MHNTSHEELHPTPTPRALVMTRRVCRSERCVSGMLHIVKAAKTALLGSKIRYHPIKNVFPEKSFTSPAEYYLIIGGGNHKSRFFPMGGEVFGRQARFLSLLAKFDAQTVAIVHKMARVSRLATFSDKTTRSWVCTTRGVVSEWPGPTLHRRFMHAPCV